MSQVDPQPMLAQISVIAQQLLAQDFQRLGLQADCVSEQLQIRDSGVSVQCTADNFRSFPQGWMVQLTFDCTAKPDSPFVISDTNVGIGNSLEAAIHESVTSWIDGVFAPIQSALDIRSNISEVDVYDLIISDGDGQQEPWVAFAGPFQLRGVVERRDELGQCLIDSPPLMTVMLDDLTDLLGRQSAMLLWIKLFLQRQQGGQLVAECKANNCDWLEGSQALAEYSWPSASDGLLFKQFVILKRR
jgi:hypothetical protein